MKMRQLDYTRGSRDESPPESYPTHGGVCRQAKGGRIRPRKLPMAWHRRAARLRQAWARETGLFTRASNDWDCNPEAYTKHPTRIQVLGNITMPRHHDGRAKPALLSTLAWIAEE